MDAILAAVATVTTLVGNVYDMITGNALLVVILRLVPIMPGLLPLLPVFFYSFLLLYFPLLYYTILYYTLWSLLPQVL